LPGVKHRMSRAKIFDEEDATERAMTLFWMTGYEPTSMSNLTAHMGINKGSLYHTFGSKEDLFKRALLKYDVEHRCATLARMSEITDPVVSIDTLFSLLVKQSLEDLDKKGCMLVNTAMELPRHNEDVRKIVVAGMDDFKVFFRQQLTFAKKQKSLSESIDIDQTAKGLLALVVGLRVMARGVYSESDLHAIRSQAMQLIGK